MDLVINDVLIPDFKTQKFVKGCVGINKGRVVEVSQAPLKGEVVLDGKEAYLSPGLIDCHCHIESSYLIPSQFGTQALKRGVLHIVADCHEIANVAGRKGLEFFIKDSENTKCNILFAVPSCVPATSFATSGGEITLEDVETLFHYEKVVALGELMNYEGVINKEEKFVKMIELAKKYGKVVNGHAPKLTGEKLRAYVSAGIEDDHENETYEEVLEKIQAGLKVFIREGSAEHTKDKAYEIIKEYSEKVMFCSDDKTAEDLITLGHIDYNLRKAISLGIEPILALKVATYNGLLHYGLKEFAEVKVGNRAYFVLFDKNFKVRKLVIDGEVYDVKNVKSKVSDVPEFLLNSFKVRPIENVPRVKHHELCILVRDGSLITEKLVLAGHDQEYDLENDILKIVNIERYGHGNRSAGKIKGFGLKRGAIATSVSHDCHNILAVGTSDKAIKAVVNAIIENQGGLALFDEKEVYLVSLRVGGIVSNEEAESLVKKLRFLKEKAKELGSPLTDPFATLSFMALEVIPHIKLTDKGLFDVDRFCYF
ncbi:MAG: adenine deaminase [Thermodesulfobacteria bacterium]|nr:adenine deaminase [Thermodesulfobacteriota bacterium]